MKKLAFSIIASFALFQTAFAATSALTESILEYEAITTAIGTNPTFNAVFQQDEFIVEIKRLTRRIDSHGIVKYGIETRTVGDDNVDRSCGHCRSHHHRVREYIAVLEVTANPEIGPNIITVISIEPLHHDH